MPQTISNRKKIQNRPEHGWWHISRHYVGWHSNSIFQSSNLYTAKQYRIFSSPKLEYASKDQKLHPYRLQFSLHGNKESYPRNIITLGCFLIATMASLRFRDLLRTRPDSISIQGHILRGISWRTKTSVSGQPWGVCCLGIVTQPSTKHWVFRFLEAVQIGIDQSRNHWGPQWSPYFLFPSWTDTIPFSSPCSYHHALALIRFYTQCSWVTPPPLLTAEQAVRLSTHSMKSTLLTAAGQPNLNLENWLPKTRWSTTRPRWSKATVTLCLRQWRLIKLIFIQLILWWCGFQFSTVISTGDKWQVSCQTCSKSYKSRIIQTILLQHQEYNLRG